MKRYTAIRSRRNVSLWTVSIGYSSQRIQTSPADIDTTALPLAGITSFLKSNFARSPRQMGIICGEAVRPGCASIVSMKINLNVSLVR